ncbi:MAG: ABC transporter permease, partial [Spirochaetales bacterium]
MKLYSIAIRNIKRNRRRSILSVSATALAAMCMVLLFSYIRGVENNLKENILTYYTGQVRIRHKDYDKNEQMNPLHLNIGSFEKVARIIDGIPGVSAVSPRISFPAAIYREDEKFVAMGLGVDFDRERLFQDLDGK